MMGLMFIYVHACLLIRRKMTAIRASLERDYRSIAKQSILSTKVMQALSRTPAAPRFFFRAASQAMSGTGRYATMSRQKDGHFFQRSVGDLVDFVQHRIRMSHIYQPVMIMTPLQN